MTKHVLHVLCAALLVAAFARPAHADDAGGGMSMSVKPPDQKDPKQKGKAPSIEVAIAGAAMLTLDKYSISTTNKGVKVTMKAEKLIPYAEGTETLAVALVVSGQKIWVGTEAYETDPTQQYNGALGSLEQAIDKLQLGTIGPSGSKGLIISYSAGAEVKVSGDLKSITGAALGGEKDYATKFNNDLTQGITMALGELEKIPTSRKVMIVIGDGNDTNADSAKKVLPQLKQQAVKDNIECFGIIYKSAISDKDSSPITTMIPTAKTVPDAAGISSELTAIVTHITQRFYLRFPGYDEKSGESLPWDGKPHDIVLKIDQAEQDPYTLQMDPPWSLPKGGFPVWAIVLLSLVGLILLIVIIKALTKKREAPMPMPMPMQMQMPMPAAPAPKGPMKTMMVDIGGGETGIPIVGWLVPLNGANQFHTWKLKPGLTKIGTAPPSDLVVNDGFMSTEHCAISCSPAGFTLIDNGSTNGTLVNDKRVSKQELFDNDVVTMGRTNFKFKSIN